MNAYLDTCLIVNAEEGLTDLNKMKEDIGISNFVYSIAHLFEAKLRNNLTPEFISERCDLLSSISDNNYIHYNTRLKKNEIILMNAIVGYNLIQAEDINQILESLPQLIPLMGQIKSLKEFPLNPREDNNLNAKDFLAKIDILWSQILGMNFKDFIKTNLPNIEQDFPFDVTKVVESIILFHLIDELGYWSDKKGKVRSRLFDSLHIYFASSCDIFITSDTNAYKKAQVVFEYYGVRTKAIYYGN